MRERIRTTVLALLALSAVAGAPTAAAAQDPPEDLRPAIAVFPFEDGGWQGVTEEDGARLGVGLQQLLLSELSRNNALRIVERNALREILEEMDLVTTGRVDPSTAAEIGRIVGARYVVLAGFTDLLGTRPILTGRVVSVETSEWLRPGEEVHGPASELYQMVVDLSFRLTDGLELPPLPASEREARRSREIPPEALRLFSQAQVLQDLGQRDEAVELYQRITREFPAMTEAGEALRQLPGT
jgi:TolB-like protein